MKLPRNYYNPISLFGSILAAVTALIIIFFMIAMTFFDTDGTGSYTGIFIYMVLPVFLIIGLILIPIGMSRRSKRIKREGEGSIVSKIVLDMSNQRHWNAVGLFILVTILFLMITGIGTYKAFHYTESNEFCGTLCHSVMEPEHVAYQESAHSRVTCVECHVGEGAQWYVNSKLSGLYQVYSVLLNKYPTPIETPIRNLRPARETCEKCHWPEKFYGHNLKVIRRYGLDENSTLKYTTLDMKIDTGKENNKAGIHWHIATENEVRYVSLDDERLEMLWVEVKQNDGSFKRFSNSALKGDFEEMNEKEISVRTMDCVDCHNRATHIYEEPEKAVDKRISKGQLDRSLPYAKRVVLAAITTNYPDKEAGLNGISNYLNGFYRRKYPDLAGQKLDHISRMIKTAQEIYSRNVHPVMKVDWGTYPSFLGHKRDTGCFRCHNSDLKDEEGKMISFDCTLCHSILSYGEDKTFKYMEIPDKKSPNYKMHKMLREEFLNRQE
ncbi:MAG: NapC/NirT family cytochrome c [Candidatus Aminicenantes bacterium]|nr:NapC/NirT family cytochrome c [Candidatus Aminicenantes bacterium]